MDTYYIDGKFVDDDHAFVSVKDIVVLRGFGVFDFLITYGRRPFCLGEHVQRFLNSAGYIGLEVRHSKSEICDIVEETVRRNPDHKESAVRMVYTGGVSSDGVTPEGRGILMVMVTPKHPTPATWYADGAKLITVDIERFIPTSKSTCYLSAVWALEQAKKEGGMEAVYVDRNNRVLEGTTTNFFCVKDDKLITPGRDILPGVTRHVIMELVKGIYTVEIRDIDRAELHGIQEAFVTASNKEIVPIVKINDMPVGDGRIGERTRNVMRLFRDYTDAYGRREKDDFLTA